VVHQGRQPFKGMEIKVVSETIPTHEYEAKTLAKAFEEITGIKVTHDLIQEGDVIEKLQTQCSRAKTLRRLYQRFRPDRHPRPIRLRGPLVRLDGRRRQGCDPAHPGCRRLYGQVLHHRTRRQALPAAGPAVCQPLLVPLRLVQTGDFKKQFKEIYGYELGVPVNWSAYEDIAEFFTEHVREIDGKAVFGHMDYGKKPRIWAGASPMPGSPWPAPATRAFPTASRLMNGVSGWKDAAPWVQPLPAAGPPTARLPSTPFKSIWTG
jgi:glycerol transport system substrate-binding protein